MVRPLSLPEPRRKTRSSPLPPMTLPPPQQRRLSAALEESRVSVPTVFDHEENKSSAPHGRPALESTSDSAPTRHREGLVMREYSLFNLDGDVTSGHHTSSNAPHPKEHGFLHNLFHHRSSNHDKEAAGASGAVGGGGKGGMTRKRNELLSFFSRHTKPDSTAPRWMTTSRHGRNGSSAPSELSMSQLQRPPSQSYSRHGDGPRLRGSTHASPLPSPHRDREPHRTTTTTGNSSTIVLPDSGNANANDEVDSRSRFYSFYAESGPRGVMNTGGDGETDNEQRPQSRLDLLSLTYDSFMWGDGGMGATVPRNAQADRAEGRSAAEETQRGSMSPPMTNHNVRNLPAMGPTAAANGGPQGNGGVVVGGNLPRRQRRSLMHTNSVSETDTNNSRYFGQLDTSATTMNGGGGGSRHSGRVGSEYSMTSQTSVASVGPTGLPPTTRPFRWMPYAANLPRRFANHQGRVPFMMNMMQAVHGARYGLQNFWANAMNRNEARMVPHGMSPTATAPRPPQAPEYMTEEDVTEVKEEEEEEEEEEERIVTSSEPEVREKALSGVAAINEAAAAMNMETLHLTDSVVKATNEVKLHSFYGPIGTLGLVASQNRAQWERATGNEGIAERIYVLMSNDREGTGPAKSEGNILLLTRMWCDPNILWEAPYVDSPNWSDAEELATEQAAEKKAAAKTSHANGAGDDAKAKPTPEDAHKNTNGGAQSTAPEPTTSRDRPEPTPSVNAMSDKNNNNSNHYSPGSFSMLPGTVEMRGDEAGAIHGTEMTLTTAADSKQSTPATQPNTASRPAAAAANIPTAPPRATHRHEIAQKPSLFATMRLPRPAVRETVTTTTVSRPAPGAGRPELASFFCEVRAFAEDEGSSGSDREVTNEGGNHQEGARYGDGVKGRRTGWRNGAENDSFIHSGPNHINNHKSKAPGDVDSEGDDAGDEAEYGTEVGSDRYSFVNNSADWRPSTGRGSRHRLVDGAVGSGGRTGEASKQQQQQEAQQQQVLVDDGALEPHSRVSSAREFVNREEGWLYNFVQRDSEGRLTTCYDTARQSLDKDYPGLDDLLIGDQTSDALSEVTGGSRRSWRYESTIAAQRGSAPVPGPNGAMNKGGRPLVASEGRVDGATSRQHGTEFNQPRQPNYTHTPNTAQYQPMRVSVNDSGHLPVVKRTKAQPNVPTKSPLTTKP